MKREEVLKDLYWVTLADFIQRKSRTDVVWGPFPLSYLFKNEMVPYEVELNRGVRFAALHKGLLHEIGRKRLEIILQEFHPVFANEVFVLYDRQRPASGQEIGAGNEHLAALSSRMVELPQVSDLQAREELGPAVYLGGYMAQARLTNGLTLCIDTRDRHLAPQILCQGHADIYLTGLFASWIKPGFTVVDIGANVGYYSLLFGFGVGDRGKVHAFEANPRIKPLLQRNIETNLYSDRITFVNKAVTDKEGKIVLRVFQNYLGSSTIGELPFDYAQRDNDVIESLEVETITLDFYFGDNIPQIDILKLDIEGCEPRALRGAEKTLARQKKILLICEFNPSLLEMCGTNPRDFLQQLRSLGFAMQVLELTGKLSQCSDDEILRLSDRKHLDLVLTRGREMLR